jgi:hypothetical protein
MKPLEEIISIEKILDDWDDRKLEKVCSEPHSIRQSRQHLNQKVATLQKGLDVCASHNFTFSVGPPCKHSST